MATYFCKLHAPRHTFLHDMSPAEAKVMQEHGAYWREAMSRGNVIAFGVVGDPAGAFGVGIVEFAGVEVAQSFTENDPTIRSGQGFRFEIHPMPFGAVWPGRA